MNGYKPYQYKGKTLLLEQYFILGSVNCIESQYDIFDKKMNDFAFNEIDSIEKDCYAPYAEFDGLREDYLVGFQNYENHKNEKTFLYTEVISKRKTKIIVSVFASKNIKLWLNGECLFITQNDDTFCYLTAHLKKGKNTILIEHFSPAIKPQTAFSIQIKNYGFEMSSDIRALSNMLSPDSDEPIIELDPVSVLTEKHETHQPSIKFMLMSNNKKINTNYEIHVYAYSVDLENYDFESSENIIEKEELVLKIENAKINRIEEVFVEALTALIKHKFCRVYIDCFFEHNGKKKLISGPYFFISDFSNVAVDFNNRFLKHLKESKNVELDKVLSIKEGQDISTIFWRTKDNIEFFNNLNIEQEKEYYLYPGFYKHTVQSDLDNSSVVIGINIPSGYNATQKHPAFIGLNTGFDPNFSQWFPELSETCLSFDITCRGATGGSYIGEASALECLSWIKSNFKIDEDRIYLLGYSNGSYSTYAISQNHPHIAAAIYPLAGFPQIETVQNLSNTPTFQMLSSRDHIYLNNINTVKKKLDRYGNYHQHELANTNHSFFTPYKFNKAILNRLLSCKLNPYPNQIVFTTCRNRHLESFWIRLHGIAKSKKYARIKANIEAENLINIRISNSLGITLTIPPQINKCHFQVKINSVLFAFENYKKDSVIFTKSAKWSTSEFETKPDFRKGTGLLDVYLNKLRIIVSDNCSDSVLKCAANLSSPQTGGFTMNIDVNYPVFKLSEMPENILSNNLIVFDMCENNDFIKLCKTNSTIDYDEYGYVYKGKRKNCNYVIMQAIANPINENLSILIISTNKENLLTKNLFMRRLVLPFYSNGLHPYLNNNALVFSEGKYYAIYERDVDMEEVK